MKKTRPRPVTGEALASPPLATVQLPLPSASAMSVAGATVGCSWAGRHWTPGCAAGFRHIRGCGEMLALIRALDRHQVDITKEVA
jgi:hypothetical protein